ncbi:MAG: tandem-95 repeat protein, partial [Pseudomonadota bacterium]
VNGETLSAVEDTPLTISASALLANDTDVDGDPLTIISVQDATNGTVSLVGGNIVFTPNADYNGPASFTYTVSDGQGGVSTATVTVNVGAVNDTPVAGDDIASTPINTPLANIAVLANDSDVDGDTLTVTTATLNDPAQGTVTINADGTLNFTPATNVSGPVVITYTVSDGHGGTDTATLTVNVGTNTPPESTDITLSGTEDTPLTLNVADFGFSDADAGQALANVRVDTLPANGTLLFNGSTVTAGQVISRADIAAGRLSFVPGADGNGTGYASFTFSVQDSGGAFDATPNTIAFDIAAVNDAPVGGPDTFSAAEDTPLTIPATALLANDSDVDGDTLALISVQDAVNGSVSLAGGNVVFTPNANYNGPASFTYTVSDGHGGTSIVSVSVNIGAVNDAPVAGDDIASTPVNTPLLNIAVLANDSDVDGDALTVISATLNDPTQGTVTVNPNGTLNFTPATNVSGPVVITYTVSDGHGGTDTATLTVNVGANTSPDSVDVTVQGTEDTPVVLTTAAFDFVDADNGQTLANVRIDTLPGRGTLLLNGVAVAQGQVVSAADIAAGRLSFVPAADGNGTGYTSFTFSVQDSDGAFDSTPNTVTIDIAAVNDAPVAGNDTASTPINTPLTNIPVLANDSDVDGDPLTVTGATLNDPAQGTVSINADGTLNFTPAANVSGAVVITYTVSDGHGGVATATLTVNVGANTPPDSVDVRLNGTEDTPLTLGLNDFAFADADTGQTLTSVRIDTLPSQGTLLLNGVAVVQGQVISAADIAASRLSFVPAADGNGTGYASFTFSVQDSAGAFDATPNTVTIDISAVNDAPMVRPDTAASANGATVVIDVLANDSDPEGGSLTIRAIEGVPIAVGGSVAVTGGTVTLNADGTLSFVPQPGFSGTPSFSYTAVDRDGAAATGTVSLSVSPAVQPPEPPEPSVPPVPPAEPPASADVGQLLAIGEPDWPAGWDIRTEWGYKAYELKPIEVPLHIDEAVNSIRPLYGIQFLEGKEPLRTALDAIRSLNGTPSLDSSTPIVDVVESLQRRFVMLDPVRAMFSRQGDARIFDATQSGQQVLAGDTADRPADASNDPRIGNERAPAQPQRAAVPPLRAAILPAAEVGGLLFSEQIAFYVGQSATETEQLAAALRAQPVVEINL